MGSALTAGGPPQPARPASWCWAPWRAVRRRWRRSLALRVVASTLVASIALITLLGFFLVDRVGRGLVKAKQDAALAEVRAGVQRAAAELRVVPTGPNDVQAAIQQIAADLVGRGGTAGQFDVALLPTGGRFPGILAGDELQISDVPAALRQRVESGVDEEWTYHAVGRGGRPVEALVVGAPLAVPSGQYEVYYVFPLTPEEKTLSLVRRILLFGGLALVLLLATVAWIVTRQVVRPVRLAARIAGRLAAGRLQERLEVRGEDDLARLAMSFNEMAAGLQTQITRLEDLSRLQRRFTADVSHELRTPLTTVRMAADVLHGARVDFAPEVARSAELLQTELDRFESLLVDLLEISRYDAGAAELEPEQVDLVGLIRSVVESCRPLAERRDCSLDLSPLPRQAVLAEVDPRRMSRILRNLVVNAIEYGEGRPVVLRLAADDEVAAVQVRDFGVGLRPEDVEAVFGRFWRADPSRARQSGGTGLGLSIAQEDARLHGGWLAAWGRPGGGAAMRLVVPRRAGGRVSRSPLPLEPVDALPPGGIAPITPAARRPAAPPPAGAGAAVASAGSPVAVSDPWPDRETR